jgi:hypothetical protein
MTLRKAQRFAAVAVLAGSLFLVAAPVQARDLGPAPNVWQWMQDLQKIWKGVSFFWVWSDQPRPQNSGDLRKGGGALDPNGSPGSTTPPASASGDAGHISDPNS